MDANDYEFNGQPWSVLFNLTGVSGTSRVLVVPERTFVQPTPSTTGNPYVEGWGLVITGIHYNMRGTAGNGFTLQVRDYTYSPGGSETYPLYSATCAAATVSTTQSLCGLFIPLSRGTRLPTANANGAQLEIVQITGAPTSGHVMVTGFHTTKDFGKPPFLQTPNASPSLAF